MNRRQIKNKVIVALSQKNVNHVFLALKDIETRLVINPLFTCLCNTQPVIRWHAVSMFGRVVQGIAKQNLEDARVVMRRFLWMLNDESGGIGWGVPEAMAEVMCNNDTLAEEYVNMLVSYTLDDGPEIHQDGNFLELPQLQQGVLWGLVRLSFSHAELLLEHKVDKNLEPYFHSADATVQGLVCYLADLLGLQRYKNHASELCHSKKAFNLYTDGAFYHLTVGEVASDFIHGNEMCKKRLLLLPSSEEQL